MKYLAMFLLFDLGLVLGFLFAVKIMTKLPKLRLMIREHARMKTALEHIKDFTNSVPNPGSWLMINKVATVALEQEDSDLSKVGR